MPQFLHERWLGHGHGADLGVLGAADMRVDLTQE